MTLYDRFRLYALNPNKISVVRGRVISNTWFINVGNSGYSVMVPTYEDAVNEINKLVSGHGQEKIV